MYLRFAEELQERSTPCWDTHLILVRVSEILSYKYRGSGSNLKTNNDIEAGMLLE